MVLNLIMLGPPGAGKGTQADLIARLRGIPKISTGDILREAVRRGTAIGRRASAIMSQGKLLGDDVMIEIVRERLDQKDAHQGFLLDGFPRTVPQAEALDGMMGGRDPLIVVEIAVPEAELVRRLLVRMVCEACGATVGPGEGGVCRRCGGKLVQRSDDDDAVVRERLGVYLRETRPLIAYYEKRPTFRLVNGSQPPDRVGAGLLAAIDSAESGVAKGAGP